MSLPFILSRVQRQAVGLGLLLAVLLATTGWSLLLPPKLAEAEPVEVVISPQTTAGQIAKLLQEKGLVRSALAFRLLAKATGLDSQLKAGRYFITPGQSPTSILATLARGDVREAEIRVTIPEGYTVEQMAELLEQKGVTPKDEFLQAAQSELLKSRFFSEPPREGTKLRWEGFLFPDTYSFRPGSPAMEVAQRMLDRMDQVWSEETAGRSDLPLGLTPEELVTLASLVEREAKAAAERPVVARVFYNRLEAKMSLQSCATVQYLLPEPKPRLSEADTRIPSPYNTYLHPGLPPGPIAAPGRESLKAVLNPAPANYLYFVAKADGTHAFSTTYREHLENQRRYQK